MLSDDIRTALKYLHTERGRLMAFSKAAKLNYNALLKFIRTPGRQLEHDTAMAIIAALPAELKPQEAA